MVINSISDINCVPIIFYFFKDYTFMFILDGNLHDFSDDHTTPGHADTLKQLKTTFVSEPNIVIIWLNAKHTEGLDFVQEVLVTQNDIMIVRLALPHQNLNAKCVFMTLFFYPA